MKDSIKSMQDEWHRLKALWVNEGCPSSSQNRKAFDFWDRKLSQRLWDDAAEIRAADRAKHPKAKRNQATPLSEIGVGRCFP